MIGRPCPHGDPHCPCNDDILACHYEDTPTTGRSRCIRTGTLDCRCADDWERAGWCEECNDYPLFCDHQERRTA